jgi:hypothetical protein
MPSSSPSSRRSAPSAAWCATSSSTSARWRRPPTSSPAPTVRPSSRCRSSSCAASTTAACWCARTPASRQPKDLEGKKVGVRAYSVTTGVWLRQVLIDEFGVDPSKVTWVVDDEEHVTQLVLPPNVIHAPEGSSLADMMASGELVAGLEGAAGIGRTGAPTGGWQEVEADYPDLLPNAAELEAEYLRPHRHLPDARHHRGQGLGAGRASVDRQVALQRFRPGQEGMAGAARRRRSHHRHRQEVPRTAQDRRPRPAALRYRGKPQDHRGAGTDRIQAGPDAAPHVDGRAVRRSKHCASGNETENT